VFVVESTSHEDQRRGISEGPKLVEIASQLGLPAVCHTVTNAQDFDECLRDDLPQVVNREKTLPMLHISAHGNGDGLILTSGEIIKWWDLKVELAAANKACHGGLIVCMSSCEGVAGLKMVMQTEGPMPFLVMVGCKTKPLWAEAAIAYATFYKEISQGAVFEPAVEAMRVASGNRDFALGLAEPTRRWFEHYVRTGKFAKFSEI
jgi:hypothetical protein